MRYAIILCVALLLGCDDALPQAKYADGTEWQPAMPLSPGGVIPRDMDARAWDRFVAQAGIQADGKVKTFTPTSWGGFGADPSGEISYMDFGALVVLWVDSALTGTSDDVNFTLQGLPESLQPRANRLVTSSGMLNNANSAMGEAQVFGRDEVFAGNINFSILRTDAVANFATPSYTGWTNSGNKGLHSGWLLQYAK